MPRRLALLAVVAAVACGGGEEPPDYDRNGAIEVVLGFKDASGTFTTPDPAELRRTLKELGLRGNSDHYTDPANSLLDQVLSRRLGIPLSISVIYLLVAQRLGLELEPVGVPGHFLVGCYEPEGPFYLDAFNQGLLLTALPTSPAADRSERRSAADAASLDRLVVLDATRTGGELIAWGAEHGLVVTTLNTSPRLDEFAFDPLLRDLAEHTDRATARTTAKFTEHPAGHLDLTGPAWPWRSTVLGLVAVLLAVGAGLLPHLIRSIMFSKRGRP